jgi:hypothetical protein
MVALILFVCGSLSQTLPEPGQPSPGTISGTVIYKTGAPIVGAKVTLSHGENKPGTDVVSGAEGQFSFTDVPSGPFRITVSAPGFGDQATPGNLNPGEGSVLAPIILAISAVASDIDVTLSKTEVAEEQIKEQVQQRLVGLIPNFNVSYDQDAVPLTTRQKFKLAIRYTVDPAPFIVAAALGGIQQARNDYPGFGQGAAGYAKRSAAEYGNFLVGTMVNNAIMPSIFKQDPRYFYKGTGTAKSRIFYAISRTVIRKGDNGKWQPDYSGILGRLVSGGISNLYYPAQDRNGVALTFENALISVGADAGVYLAQEFLFKKLTTHSSKPKPIQATPKPKKP